MENGTADAIAVAAEHGRICAVAMDCQLDLWSCARRHPDLFPPDPFDARLFSAIALVNAFGSPGCTPDELAIATRTTLWVFAADWRVDHAATSADEIGEIVRACLAVADGGSGSGPLAAFLAEIRDELATSAPFATLGHVWRDELERYLTAAAREWRWKTARDTGPTFAEYLDNSDNIASTWVNVSHWLFTCGPRALDRLPDLVAASREVQRVLRLLNDLASYERDLRWGDLNALLLGVDRAEVGARVAALVADCAKAFEPLRAACPQEVAYLERQLGYSTGFYGMTDYWGKSDG
ncbi:terpene synthase family protein [Thermopolyspora sp. NPDC052614]|uniref:terpene synthase family protein n=1 Tax=Thermopolyspora sp. NPDC052614 TaxID=3155682 RepID=UPI00342E7672